MSSEEAKKDSKVFLVPYCSDKMDRLTYFNRQKQMLQASETLILHKSYSMPVHMGESVTELQSDVFSSISYLYSQYLADLSSRLQSRVSSTLKVQTISKYSLEIDREFRHRLKNNIAHLVESEDLVDLVSCFTECVHIFIEGIDEELSYEPSKFLNLVFLIEAYYTVQNAADEISKIVSPIFQGDKNKAYALNLKVFYDRFLQSNPNLLRFAHECCNEFGSEVLKIEEEINVVVNSDDTKVELLQSMSVDELVGYINSNGLHDSPKRQKKRKKRSKRFENQIDSEIEDFKRRLDLGSPSSQKLKPKIDQRYLSKWRRIYN